MLRRAPPLIRKTRAQLKSEGPGRLSRRQPPQAKQLRRSATPQEDAAAQQQHDEEAEHAGEDADVLDALDAFSALAGERHRTAQCCALLRLSHGARVVERAATLGQCMTQAARCAVHDREPGVALSRGGASMCCAAVAPDLAEHAEKVADASPSAAAAERPDAAMAEASGAAVGVPEAAVPGQAAAEAAQARQVDGWLDELRARHGWGSFQGLVSCKCAVRMQQRGAPHSSPSGMLMPWDGGGSTLSGAGEVEAARHQAGAGI